MNDYVRVIGGLLLFNVGLFGVCLVALWLGMDNPSVLVPIGNVLGLLGVGLFGK